MANRPKEYTPKWWLWAYLENMFDNNEAEEFDTWEDFFNHAKGGAYDWCLTDCHDEHKRPWDKVWKMTDRGFGDMKRIFNEMKNN